MTEHPNKVQAQRVWDGIAIGDYSAALEGPTFEDVEIWHGPGAGRFAGHNKGVGTNGEMLVHFLEVFGGTFAQDGNCVYADDRCSISLVHESGTTPDGDVFDNMAIWIGRINTDGATDAVWTIDLDYEACRSFWAARGVTTP